MNINQTTKHSNPHYNDHLGRLSGQQIWLGCDKGYVIGRISGTVTGQLALHGTVYSQFGLKGLNVSLAISMISGVFSAFARESSGGFSFLPATYVHGIRGAYGDESFSVHNFWYNREKPDAGMKRPKLLGGISGGAISLWQVVTTPLAHAFLCATLFSKTGHAITHTLGMITPTDKKLRKLGL